MKTISTLFAILLLAGSALRASEQPHHEPYTGSAEFERLKALAGTWQGEMVMQGKPQTLHVEYRVTAAGSTLLETIFPGTSEEMISVYHDTGGKPGMTHYCAMKNRPNMVMASSTDSRMHFTFTESDGIDAAQDAHMHELTIHFVDDNTIAQDWVLYRGGKAVEATSIELTRR